MYRDEPFAFSIMPSVHVNVFLSLFVGRRCALEGSSCRRPLQGPCAAYGLRDGHGASSTRRVVNQSIGLSRIGIHVILGRSHTNTKTVGVNPSFNSWRARLTRRSRACRHPSSRCTQTRLHPDGIRIVVAASQE